MPQIYKKHRAWSMGHGAWKESPSIKLANLA